MTDLNPMGRASIPKPMIRTPFFLLAAVIGISASTASAQNREVPYWASIRAEVMNTRVGPSKDYRIAWVYKRKGLPMKVIRVVEGWRLVEDPAGDQGWVVSRLLNPERSAIVIGEGTTDILAQPKRGAKIKWKAQPGVVGALGKCDAGFCEFISDGHKGWVAENRLWGVGAP